MVDEKVDAPAEAPPADVPTAAALELRDARIAELEAANAALENGVEERDARIEGLKEKLEKATAPPTAHLGEEYDRIEQQVHSTWLPSAPAGRVVAGAVAGLPEDSPVERIVNVVRRAYHAHTNRPE